MSVSSQHVLCIVCSKTIKPCHRDITCDKMPNVCSCKKSRKLKPKEKARDKCIVSECRKSQAGRVYMLHSLIFLDLKSI